MTNLVLSRNDVQASDGTYLTIGDLVQTLSYNVDLTLNYVQVTFNGNLYQQTYGYTSGNLTSISNWVKQ